MQNEYGAPPLDPYGYEGYGGSVPPQMPNPQEIAAQKMRMGQSLENAAPQNMQGSPAHPAVGADPGGFPPAGMAAPQDEYQAKIQRARELTGIRGPLSPEIERVMVAQVDRVEAERAQHQAEIEEFRRDPRAYNQKKVKELDDWTRRQVQEYYGGNPFEGNGSVNDPQPQQEAQPNHPSQPMPRQAPYPRQAPPPQRVPYHGGAPTNHAPVRPGVPPPPPKLYRVEGEETSSPSPPPRQQNNPGTGPRTPQEAMQRIKSRENQNDPGAPWSWGDFASGTAQSVYDTVTGIPGQIVDQGRQRYGEMAEAYRKNPVKAAVTHHPVTYAVADTLGALDAMGRPVVQSLNRAFGNDSRPAKQFGREEGPGIATMAASGVAGKVLKGRAARTAQNRQTVRGALDSAFAEADELAGTPPRPKAPAPQGGNTPPPSSGNSRAAAYATQGEVAGIKAGMPQPQNVKSRGRNPYAQTGEATAKNVIKSQPRPNNPHPVAAPPPAAESPAPAAKAPAAEVPAKKPRAPRTPKAAEAPSAPPPTPGSAEWERYTKQGFQAGLDAATPQPKNIRSNQNPYARTGEQTAKNVIGSQPKLNAPEAPAKKPRQRKGANTVAEQQQQAVQAEAAEAKLTPQQKAAITRAKNAEARAKAEAEAAKAAAPAKNKSDYNPDRPFTKGRRSGRVIDVTEAAKAGKLQNPPERARVFPRNYSTGNLGPENAPSKPSTAGQYVNQEAPKKAVNVRLVRPAAQASNASSASPPRDLRKALEARVNPNTVARPGVKVNNPSGGGFNATNQPQYTEVNGVRRANPAASPQPSRSTNPSPSRNRAGAKEFLQNVEESPRPAELKETKKKK